jgi:hypothetical protein
LYNFIKIRHPFWFLSKESYTDNRTMAAYSSYVTKFVELSKGSINLTKSVKEDISRMIELEKEMALVRLKPF